MTFSKLTWQKSLRGASLTASEFRLLIVVASYTDKNGRNAFPGVANLARDCNVDERAVKRTLRELEAKRWLLVVEPGGNAYGKGRATTYALGSGPLARATSGPTPAGNQGLESPKGGLSDTQGGYSWSGKGDVSTTPPGHSSDHQHHSEGKPSAPTHVDAAREDPWGEPARPDYEAMRDDYDVLCEWLHQEVGYDIASEPLLCNAALGMWENEQHPVAIRNTLLKADQT